MIKELFYKAQQLFFLIKRTLNAEKRIKKENKPILKRTKNGYLKRVFFVKKNSRDNNHD
jgi:hypothetical protein